MRDSDPRGLYGVLGVQPSATAEEIKSAYRRLAKDTHPDTSGGKSTDRFHRVSEAYEILGDPARRAEYDSSGYQATTQEAEVRTIDPICCSRCGQVTAQPRYVVFFRVYSFVLATMRNPVQGIFCASCARGEALKSSLITMFTGWWGFPWGPIYTFGAILSNGFGGKHEKKSDEMLTWYNALAFLSRGNLKLSYALASLSKRAEDRTIAADASELVQQLENAGVDPRQSRLKNPWRVPLASAAAHLLMALSLPGIIAAFFLLDSPSNRTPYRPQRVTTQPTVPQRVAVEPNVPTCSRPPHNGEILGASRLSRDDGHALEIRNGGGGNAIIKVRQAPSNAVIATFFVSRNQTARIQGIPDGQYRVQYAFGDRLDESCSNFIQMAGVGQFPGVETLRTERTHTQIITQILSYTLYTVPSGNVRPQTISASDFNRP